MKTWIAGVALACVARAEPPNVVFILVENRPKPFSLQLSHYAVHSPFQPLEIAINLRERFGVGSALSAEDREAVRRQGEAGNFGCRQFKRPPLGSRLSLHP